MSSSASSLSSHCKGDDEDHDYENYFDDGNASYDIDGGCDFVWAADVRYCGHPLNHMADYVQLFIGDGDYDDQGYDNVAE